MRGMFVCWLTLVTLVPPAHAAIQPLALSGESVPGVAGATWEAFTVASLNAAGQAVFGGTLQGDGITPANDQVLSTFASGSVTPLTRTGTANVPDVAGAQFAGFADVVLADTGEALVRGSLVSGPGGVSPQTNQGLWRFAPTGDDLLVQTGSGNSPGVMGAPFSAIPNVLSTTTTGANALVGQLVRTGAVTTANDTGLWSYSAAGGTLLAREGNSSVPNVANARFAAFGKPALNATGQVAFRATLLEESLVNATNRNGIWRYSATAGELLARQGSSAPGTTSTFSTFSQPDLNSAGQVAFRANLNSGGSGLWLYAARGENGTSEGERITPDAVPGVAGATFAGFGDSELADSGTVVALATLTTGPGGVTPQNNQGLWAFAADGAQLLARTGSGSVPGVAAANFAEFEEFALNAGGSVLLAATLQPGLGGVDATNDAGLWLLPTAGEPQLVARTGDQLAGRTIAGLSLLSDEFLGRPIRGFNEQDQILFHATFSSGETGLFLFSPDGPSTADFNQDGAIDATDLTLWQAAYGESSGGDTDTDGDTDGVDFLAWQRQYTGPPATVAASPAAPFRNLPACGSPGGWRCCRRSVGELPRNLGIMRAICTSGRGVGYAPSPRRYEPIPIHSLEPR